MNVWYLIAVFLHGDFSLTPFVSEAACLQAEANMPTQIVRQSECQPVWLDWPIFDHPAPQSSPLPLPRPEE